MLFSLAKQIYPMIPDIRSIYYYPERNADLFHDLNSQDQIIQAKGCRFGNKNAKITSFTDAITGQEVPGGASMITVLFG